MQAVCTPLAFTSTQSGKLHPCMTRIDRSRLVLWSQSSQVIQSYVMFLFSGRGYWQAIIWAHKVVVAAHVLVGFPTHMRAGLHPAINGISTGRTGLGPWHQTAINASNVSANLGYKFGFGQYVCTSSVQLGFEVMQTVLSVMCTRMSGVECLRCA